MKKKAVRNDICAVITVFNEENKITNCIKSAQELTNNIIVIDTQSTDNTAKIAKDLGATLFKFPFHRYVEPARQFSIKKAAADWVLLLDADERITKELAREIKTVIPNATPTHFKIPRKNIFANKQWLKHGGWYPDYATRLIRKKAFVNWSSKIHSTPKISGEMGCLKHPLNHYFHDDLESMVAKTTVFENVESELLYRAKKTATMKVFFRKYFGELWRRLYRNFGFMDGTYGIIESIYQAYSKTITYLMLYEKNKTAGRL